MTESLLIVAYDGSASAERALLWAARRAAAEAVPLRVATVRARGLAAEDVVRRGVATAARHGAEASGTLLDGSIAAALLRATTQDSLLVVGTDRSTTNLGPVLGALPLKLAASASCPLAVIPRDSAARRTGVICGFDADAEGDEALAFAVEEARRTRTRLRILHIQNGPTIIPSATETQLAHEHAARQFAEGRIESSLDRLRDRCAGIEVFTEVRVGDPAMILLAQAKHAELLVIGSHGKTALDTFLLGSVSHDVLMNIDCPVIVMPAVPSGRRERSASPLVEAAGGASVD